ncbi:unnamed protein product [Amoebophrya sp. A120]|nr:unnamed protein product [Amoebophrya sp. A120]|eukprot:GSA120T00018730001.1
MVVVKRYEKTVADPEAAYRAGTLIRVKWPHVDGTDGWYTAMLTAVSERVKPVRKRRKPSHYRYTLMWADGSKSLETRLLHLKHETRFKPKTRDGARAFIHCGNAKVELPVGISYDQRKNSTCKSKAVPRLRVAQTFGVLRG